MINLIEGIMRKIEKILSIIFISLAIFSCNEKEITSSVHIKKLDNYPSASAIECYDGKLYLMGDDATNLLILDTNLNIIDSVSFFSYPDKRIPKNIKPDLEASALYYDSSDTLIFLFGSGSLPPRNSAWSYNFKTKIKASFSLLPLYSQIKQEGIEQLNIEGACFVQDKLILVNRGNKGYPENHLIITDEKFWNKDSIFKIFIIPFALQKDTTSFKGISGLSYSKLNDQLIMTVSTEDTRSVHEDGAIGKSYLWVINNISNKLNSKSINADKVIDLEKIDSRFKGQKIESATVISESSELIHLALVADNDDGSSTVFKMSIERN